MNTPMQYATPEIETLSGAEIVERFGPTAGGSLTGGLSATPPSNSRTRDRN
jgi:hypothetical protein